jgi:MFS family permease
MTAAADTSVADAASSRRNEQRAAGVAFGAHALHDGYTDLIYVMLPIWQAEFGLSYAALGLLRGLFSGSMAGLQIPATFLADRIGATVVLAAGTALSGLGYCVAGFSVGLPMLVVALALGGVGSSTQHPLGSALIANAFAGTRSLKALGTYNFAGDIGKMTVPAATALMITVMAWRSSLLIVGAVGIVAAIAIFIVMPRQADRSHGAGKSKDADVAAIPRLAFGFPVLCAIGVLDSATRMAFLTFLPFVLESKGATLPTVGFALTLVFAGGAVGKLVCALIGARVGIFGTILLTEGLTAATIVALLPLSLEPALALLPFIGIALNGTSSVLYGSVPIFVETTQRSRAFGIFYTATIGSGAIAPIVFGFAGDTIGVPATIVCVAAVSLATLPLATVLRPVLKHAR